ncbi:hypothetical protein JCM19039_4040 [Geomicrobium sp. JCM 19039]|nr:hypothetical protein JCM19039_4040 [Geomicrobium sp. JCM 19039]
MLTRGMLHHIELYVSDLHTASQFWGWFLEGLGYEPFQQWAEGASWKLGDTYIVFVQTEDKYLDVPYHRKRTGLNHLAFHADSHRHVDEMTEELKARGFNVLYEDKHPYAGGPDYYAVYFEGPDRMKVELVAP